MEQFREFRVGGQRLAASIHIPEQTPGPGLVMCHGFTGHRIEAHFLFVKAARAFCDAGLNVLRFDFRGSGESEGAFREMTIEGEIEDALAALQLLRGEPTVAASRVGVLGLSLGGLVAACAAARDGDVKALVLWSAVASMADLVRERWSSAEARGSLELRGYYEQGAFEIGAGFIAGAPVVNPLREVKQYHGPALILHGDEDESVPVAHAQMYADALPGDDTTTHTILGADHTYATVPWECEAIEVSRDWLAERL